MVEVSVLKHHFLVAAAKFSFTWASAAHLFRVILNIFNRTPQLPLYVEQKEESWGEHPLPCEQLNPRETLGSHLLCLTLGVPKGIQNTSDNAAQEVSSNARVK